MSNSTQQQQQLPTTHLKSCIWKIKNFQNVEAKNFGHEFNIECKQHHFYFGIDPNERINRFSSKDSVAFYIFRYQSRKSDVKVQWKIAFINQREEEEYSAEISTSFTVKSDFHPVAGGVYHIDRNILLDPMKGLLIDDILTIKCKVLDPDDTNEQQIVHSKIFQDYKSLLLNPKFSDVVFIVGGKEFKLHKNVLAARSQIFEALFFSVSEDAVPNRIEVTDIDVEVFEVLLRYIYWGNVDSVELYAEGLLVAAEKYQLESLKSVCVHSLMNNISIDSVAKVITLADMYGLTELKSKCLTFFTENAKNVVRTDGWKEMVAKSNDRVKLLHKLYEELSVHRNILKRQLSP